MREGGAGSRSQARAAARRTRALDALGEAIVESAALEVPPAVTEIRPAQGHTPKLPAEAFELARQVYYERHGTLADAARAVIAAGLSETTDLQRVYGRLKMWWRREDWPMRPTGVTFAIRDANFDGGLIRSETLCKGRATGNGPAPAGQPCGESPLRDSEFCAHHDPRPEYVARRERQAAVLQQARMADAVPLAPFVAWCEKRRREMLEEARRGENPVHPNATGWAMLADAMHVDQSQLGRLCSGRSSRQRAITTVKARTIVRYLEPLDDVCFEDIYGHPPPPAKLALTEQRQTCPRCGGPKFHQADLCRSCYDSVGEGEQCSYVNRRGRRCTVRTRHESGFCHKCRRIVFREPRPRRHRQSDLRIPMLILATGAYLETPRLSAVGRRMWAANVDGVRGVYSSAKSLSGALSKYFRKRGWTSLESIRAAHEELVSTHGEVSWTAADDVLPLEASGVLPAEPWALWLRERHAELGTYAKLARKLGIGADLISRRIRGEGGSMVYASTVERALASWGDGTTLDDLYRGLR